MTERQPQPIPRPRRLGACAIAIIDVLQEHRITGAQFFKTHHARVEFQFQGRPIKFYFPCTPKSGDNAAKRTRSKLLRQMGVA